MMIHHNSTLAHVKDELLSIQMHLECKAHFSRKKQKACRQLTVRRAIEQHFERKQLQRELCSDWWDEE